MAAKIEGLSFLPTNHLNVVRRREFAKSADGSLKGGNLCARVVETGYQTVQLALLGKRLVALKINDYIILASVVLKVMQYLPTTVCAAAM